MKQIIIDFEIKDYENILKICKGLRITPKRFCEGCIETMLDKFLEELGYE